jgi:hypothetical protein
MIIKKPAVSTAALRQLTGCRVVFTSVSEEKVSTAPCEQITSYPIGSWALLRTGLRVAGTRAVGDPLRLMQHFLHPQTPARAVRKVPIDGLAFR